MQFSAFPLGFCVFSYIRGYCDFARPREPMSNVLGVHFGSPVISFAVDSVKVVRICVKLAARFGSVAYGKSGGTILLCCRNLRALRFRLVLFRKNFSVDFHTISFDVKLLQRSDLGVPLRGLRSS